MRPARSPVLPHLVLLPAVCVTLFPVLWVARMAFTDSQGFSLTMELFPSEPTLKNFAHFLGHRDSTGQWSFGRQLLNSLVVSGATTLVGMFLAATAGYAFSRFRFPGRRAGLMAFLVSQLFPGTLMMVPLYLLLDAMGLLDTLAGLVLVYSTTSLPFCVWMLKGYFDTIPRDLEEAALIDGASQSRIFWRIILPLARPALAVTALFAFLTAWNEFIVAAKFISREETYTLPVVLNSYVGSRDVYWGYFAAGALLVSLPVVALFFALQKHLVGGLTAGSVKG